MESEDIDSDTDRDESPFGVRSPPISLLDLVNNGSAISEKAETADVTPIEEVVEEQKPIEEMDENELLYEFSQRSAKYGDSHDSTAEVISLFLVHELASW